MAKMIYTKGVTDVGEALFAHTLAPEEFNGKTTNKYSVMLKLAPKAEKALIEQIHAEWTKFTESEEGQKHKYKYEPSTGIKEYNDETYFKFKMTAVIHTRQGKDWERHVPIFDAKCKEISGNTEELGNGSKVKVAYELVPFYMNDRNYGVSLRLTGIQVLKFEAQGESADALGFGQEEGFTYHEEDNADVDVPFDTEEGDF